MEECFNKLVKKSTIRKELLDFCKADDNWIDPSVGTFLQKKPPQHLIFCDPSLKHICENYTAIEYFSTNVNIFMIRPWTHYMMHIDRDRTSSINLMINDYSDSISYFQTTPPYNKLHINIRELAYETDTYYLFNSRIPHAVTNRSIPRYVLSITLNDNYANMHNYLKNQEFL